MSSGSDTCPSCGEGLTWRGQYPAVSRVDNTTHVCALCGQAEALAAWKDIPFPEWPIEGGRVGYAIYLLDNGLGFNVLEMEAAAADFVERGGVEPPSPAS